MTEIQRYEAAVKGTSRERFDKVFRKWNKLDSGQKLSIIKAQAEAGMCSIDEFLSHIEKNEKFDTETKAWTSGCQKKK